MSEWLNLVIIIFISISSAIYLVFGLLYSIYSIRLDKEEYENRWWYKLGGIVVLIPLFVVFFPIAVAYFPIYVSKKSKGE